MFKNPFVYKIPDAELFGIATTFEDFNVQLDDNNKVSYWTENTILPAGTQNIYTGTISGNIWHSIENHTYSNVLYGLASNQTLSGDIHFYGKNLVLNNAAFTGNSQSKCNNIYVNLYNVSPSSTTYCIGGECNNAYINLASGNYGVANTSGNSFYIYQRGKGLNNNKTKVNNLYFTCNDCIFNNNVYVGPNVKTNSNATGMVFEINDIHATLNSGQTTRNTQENSIWIGGIYSGQNNKQCATINNINVVINGR